MSQTNDRRKTFNTPLEFWQWAIMEPGKRKARQTHGTLFWCETLDLSGAVCCINDSMQRTALTITMCPLTAVEDEHGVIEDNEEKEKVQLWLETACDLIRASTFSGNDVKDKHNYDKSAAGMMIEAIQIIADERIAAATVQDGYNRIDGGTEWRDNGIMRLKPKGESK